MDMFGDSFIALIVLPSIGVEDVQADSQPEVAPKAVPDEAKRRAACAIDDVASRRPSGLAGSCRMKVRVVCRSMTLERHWSGTWESTCHIPIPKRLGTPGATKKCLSPWLGPHEGC